MWQCANCGYTDEDGSTFEEEIDPENPDEIVRYCPECGSDEVYQVDEEDDDDLYDDDDEEWEDEDEDFEDAVDEVDDDTW